MQTPSTSLGRFRLRHQLGQGAQATVWLAHDPRLDRDVAVKLLKQGEDTAIGDWLAEARNVSRLTHPHVVPVFEADTQDNQPYMVFEYVPGQTLAERLRQRGALAPREAVSMMLGVLDALSAAHDAGLVHRDLKPSNILVDGQGRARVMDFGIAARVHDDADDRRIVGTPGYMSPEAARGEPPSAAMDVFSAGLVLAEMLSGQPVLRERDPYRALHRVMQEDLPLPSGLPPEVDDTLRAALRRAIARDPSLRTPSAAALHAALAGWLHPAPAEASGAAGKGVLDFLLRRMRHRSDFPAMSDAIARIQRVANSERESVSSLSNEILKDVALTNKLLRLVNTAQYRHAGGGTISTVSRAVALIGFAGIRNMALSLVMLEHMQDKAHANQLKDEFLRSLMAGSIAGELAAQPREGEEAFIGAMFQHLGRLLTEFYFPEEARQVRALTRRGGDAAAGREGRSEAAASVSVLGLSYEELGIGVAKSWGLPEALQRCMSRPADDAPARVSERDRPRWLTAAANDVADALLHTDPARLGTRLDEIGDRYAKALGIPGKDLRSAAERAREQLARMAGAMKISVPAGSPARRLLDAAPAGDAGATAADAATLVLVHEGAAGASAGDPLAAHALQPTVVLGEPTTLPGKAADVLSSGIQDITNAMVSEQFKLNEVLRTILEVMYRALGFRRVVFCLRDPKTETLCGRFGLGAGVEQVAAAFRIPLRPPVGRSADLFSAIAIKGVDTLIADASLPNVASKLPPWFRDDTAAPTFLLLPLTAKQLPFGLIYADKALPGAIQVGEKELNLLRTLRNQAVMAFRQAG